MAHCKHGAEPLPEKFFAALRIFRPSLKGRVKFAFATALVLLLAACASTPPPAPKLPPPDPKTQMAALERRIEDLVESERLKFAPDAKPLVVDSELVGAARLRAEDMAKQDTMAPRNADGRGAADILMERNAAFQGMLGENVAAMHFNKDDGVDAGAMAAEIVKNWMASAAHRDNLATKPFERTGVGAAVNADTVYVSQLFATDLGLPAPQLDAPAPPDTAPAPPVTKKIRKKISRH